jgi:hypothetical protein
MRFSFAISVIGLLTIVASCGGGSTQQTTGSAQVRVLQGSPDLGSVDVSVDGKILTTNLGWRKVFPLPTTSYVAVPAGTLQFQEVASGATSSPALVSSTPQLSANTYFTIVTVGEQSTGTLSTVVLTDDHSPPASGGINMRIVNGASTIGVVDLYLTAASSDPVPASPTAAAFAFKSASSYFSFPGGTAELCLNPAGVVPFSMTHCLFSVGFQPAQSGPIVQQPPTKSTLILLDPSTSGPSTGFTLPVAITSLPY